MSESRNNGDFWREFQGPNAGYVLELYERYQKDPESVDEQTRQLFAGWAPPLETGEALPLPASGGAADASRIMAVVNFAQAIRSYGHLQVQLDPLGTPPPGDPSLTPGYYGLEENDLRQLPASLIGGPVGERYVSAWEALQALRTTYCGHVGYDYSYIHIPEERDWLREAAESGRFRPPAKPVEEIRLLERLTQVEVFELFLNRIFPGRSIFSLSGLDMLIPVLDEFTRSAVEDGICMVLIGMGHRGRLNVLAHVLQKPYAQILAEFKDPTASFLARVEPGWTGDVKYHKGALGAVAENQEVELVIQMPPNPSHLEQVDPVLVGMARAADSGTNRPGQPTFYPKAALPVLIHGDASFPGQGIVAETLNLSLLPGYNTAGTLHIIANNQLGYTAPAFETRSFLYAGDLAKGFKIPVIHVNADDPEACLEAAATAFAYREKFEKDFLLDMVGYRRYGHNEGDEPSYTQPIMYRQIGQHPSVRALWGRTLIERGLIEPGKPDELVNEGMVNLQKVLEGLKPEEDLVEQTPKAPPPKAARKIHTGVPLNRLRELNESLLNVPEGFHLHPKLERAMRSRRKALEDAEKASVDWATAEQLAFASILQDGIPIRLTGEDVARGTFSQRHEVFFDVDSEETWTPLQSLPQADAAFEVYNSPVTESAALGFEFGYNLRSPECLTVWEAQYGDFVNIAQGIIDEFLVSARDKWGQTSSLVLLLPHGNEGQGPDHSSARPERLLQLAAETNLRLANPTTAAQYFHLLRRQAGLLKTDPLPLIILTPKGLLRHPMVSSRPSELAAALWRPVLDDPSAGENRDGVRRMILCSGRIYFDLATSDLRKENQDVAIARVEQLYPLPSEEILAALENYPGLEHVTWVQEEPLNMGAWEYMKLNLADLLGERWSLRYVGRSPSSSPAEGSTAWHQANQKLLIERAFSKKVNAKVSRVIMEGV